MKDTDHLTDKQRRFVELYAGGLDKVHAARAAGYQGSGAKKAGSRLLKNPIVRQEIEAIQQAGRAAAGKTLAERIAQADEDRAFARAHKNAMAAHKSTELQCRLEGYLIDRVEVVTVDLKGSLEAAKTRVLSVLDITPQPHAELGPEADLAGNGGAHWTTRVPGNPLES